MSKRNRKPPLVALIECYDLWASGAWDDSNAVYDLAEVMVHVERLIGRGPSSACREGRAPDDWRQGFLSGVFDGVEVVPFVFQASAEYEAARAVEASGLSMIVEQTEVGWQYRPVIP